MLTREPRTEWIVHVDAASGRTLARWDNLAHARGRAVVFDPSPVVAVGGRLAELVRNGRPCRPPAEAYRAVWLGGLLSRDALDGERVTTRPTRGRIRGAGGDFRRQSGDPEFLEVMAYYHADRVLAFLESMGYRGRRAIFAKPLEIDAHGTTRDLSWYSPAERRITLGTGGVDDAEDGEVIVHEVGHAVQDAICPDFGQSDEAAAIGEGFSDYLAASVFAAKKPEALRPCLMVWDKIRYAVADPPWFWRVDEQRTYDDFVHGRRAEEHENGQIWSAALWDILNEVGKETADRLIVESHFQLDAFATFAQAARAIIDADTNLEGGRHRRALVRIFEARKIRPVD